MNRNAFRFRALKEHIRNRLTADDLEAIRLTLFGGSHQDGLRYLRRRNRNP